VTETPLWKLACRRSAALKSGGALRWPPQSKTWRRFEWFTDTPGLEVKLQFIPAAEDGIPTFFFHDHISV
jgi:hypothetical protein